MGYSTNPCGSDFTIVTVVLQYGLFASVYTVLQYNGYDIKSEPLGFLPEPIDHSGQAKGGAIVFSFTTQVDAV